MQIQIQQESMELLCDLATEDGDKPEDFLAKLLLKEKNNRDIELYRRRGTFFFHRRSGKA